MKALLLALFLALPAHADTKYFGAGSVGASQLPALTGDVTSSAGSAATTAAATQANIATLSRTAGVAVHGTNTNDDPAAGYVGEQICCNTASIAAGSSNTFVNMCNITLTAGDWMMSAQTMAFTAGGSSLSAHDMGISTDSTAATFTNPFKTLGLNWLEEAAATSTGNVFQNTITNFRRSLSGSTTFYLKGSVTYTVATPNMAGTMCGLRIR